MPHLYGEEQKVLLNRAMLTGKNDVKHEMALDNFENAIQTALIDTTISRTFTEVGLRDPRQDCDYVPQHLKDAYNLPKSMANYEIDYEQVRRTDAQFKRKVPEWSG